MFSKEAIALAKPCYEAIKKISKGKWEWEPEKGELFGLPDLEYHPDNLGVYLYTVDYAVFYYHFIKKRIVETQTDYLEYCIPLLHWEEIEEILEGIGYEIGIDKLTKITSEQEKHPDKFEVIIEKTGEIGGEENWISGSTRQLAVMRAVIELGMDRG